MKHFAKIDQIEKFDQCQNPAKWAQLLAAGLKLDRSIDFSGTCAIFRKLFTSAVFLGKIFPAFNPLGISCYGCIGLAKPLLKQDSRLAFFFKPYLVQDPVAIRQFYMASETNIGTIIRTKLHRPPVPRDNVHRLQLLDYLDQRRERPLTLVSAPAGYGKSTLVSCWLDRCDSPSAWASLDEQDNELRQFMCYLLAAVQTMFPDAVGETTALVNAPTLPPLPVLAGSLANELDAIEQDFILVLDDIHRIQEKSVYNLLTELLRHPPRTMHLVLIGRRDPSLPIASLRSRGRVTEIRLNELRFTTEETASYLKTVLGDLVDEPAAAAVAEKTEGWVTGLRLAALAVRGHDDAVDKLLELKGTMVYVMDYLITEVLTAQSPIIRHYLLVTSIIDRFSAALCDALCGPGSGQGENEIDGVDFIAKLLSSGR